MGRELIEEARKKGEIRIGDDTLREEKTLNCHGENLIGIMRSSEIMK